MGHVLVTGGAGFIGSHLVEYHLKRGERVWVLDNLTTGALSNLPKDPLLRFDRSDVASFSELQEAVGKASRIYHMSATVGMFNVLSHPAQTLSNNFQSLEAILQAMKKSQSKASLLVASSSGVYWNAARGADSALHEECQLTIASEKFLNESYSLSKIANEMQALSYAYEYGLQCVVVRIFNTIGIRQSSKYGMVVPRFISQALKKEPITVFGDGTQTRSFCNVHDVVNALDLLLNTPKTSGEIFNVGNDFECSILDLAKWVIDITQSQSSIQFIPYEQAYGVKFEDVHKRRPNIDKLIQWTQFRPQWSLEETLKEIASYMIENPAAIL